MSTILQSQPTPKMLKDFLLQDNTHILTHTNSSSTGFKSYPRTQTEPDYYTGPNPAPGGVTTLPRSRSKSRAAAEALGKLITNAVKGFHSSTPLPFRGSRRFLGMGMMRKWRSKKREKVKCSGEVTNSAIVVVTVKVKDILRWRSFRDLMVDDGNHVHHAVDNEDVRVWEEVEELQPLDCDVGPSDEAPNDFTVSEGEKWDEVSDDGVASDTDVGPKKDIQNLANEEEIEQQSPVSVFESPFREEVSDEEFPSSFDQSLANMERTKQRLLESIQLFESLAGINEDYELEEDEEKEEEKECRLTEEENTNEVTKSKGYSSRGSSWFSRGEKGLEEKKECIKVMDEQKNWGKFEDERVELGVNLEVVVLNELLDEVLIDICC